jgi:hypothetical protein
MIFVELSLFFRFGWRNTLKLGSISQSINSEPLSLLTLQAERQKIQFPHLGTLYRFSMFMNFYQDLLGEEMKVPRLHRLKR